MRTDRENIKRFVEKYIGLCREFDLCFDVDCGNILLFDLNLKSRPVDMSEDEAVEVVEDYFNGIRKLIDNFIQRQ